MKTQGTFIDFILKKWLAIASGAGFILTSAYAGQWPEYSNREYEALFLKTGDCRPESMVAQEAAFFASIGLYFLTRNIIW